MAEWFKAPSWKGGEVKASVSSNLMFSAIFKNTPKIRAFFNKYLDYVLFLNVRMTPQAIIPSLFPDGWVLKSSKS